MIYNCTCVGEKKIKAKNDKEYTLLWITLYDNKENFCDCIKIFSNKSLVGVELGVTFTAKRGFNKETRESFLFDVDFTNMSVSS